MSSFLRECWELNPGPQACVANILPTELSPPTPGHHGVQSPPVVSVPGEFEERELFKPGSLRPPEQQELPHLQQQQQRS